MDSKQVVEINCEFCNKSLPQSSLLRHVGQSRECENYYGPRFMEMKKEKGRKKVQKHRSNMTVKEKKKIEKEGENCMLKMKNRK